MIFGYFYLHKGPSYKGDPSKTVSLIKSNKGYVLHKNGKPFHIRGAAGNGHFKELFEAGGNTIRLYDTLNLKKNLDDAYKNNLSVIIDIPIPPYHKSFPLSVAQRIKIKQKVRRLVGKYSYHPALLFWNLGNEINYPVVIVKNEYINLFNSLIDIIHELDPNHPVCNSNGLYKRQIVSIHLHSPELDILGFNAFGSVGFLNSRLKEVRLLVDLKPYFMSEFGYNGPWEEDLTAWSVPIEKTTAKKSEQLIARYENYKKTNKEMLNQSLGELFFYWGNKQESTHTWFSIFDQVGRKSHLYYDVAKLWGEPLSEKEESAKIDYMLIDGKGAKENLIFSPNEIRNAVLIMKHESNSNDRLKWEIYKEGWNYNSGAEKQNRPKEILEASDIGKLKFTTPKQEGPYRIFVYAYDDLGNFSTTNIPFYVLKNERSKSNI